MAAVFGFRVGDMTLSPWSVVVVLLILLIGILLTNLAVRWLDRRILAQTRVNKGVQDSLRKGASYAGYIIAALLAFTAAGLDFSSLALIAGALGVGIGFGLQSIVNNFVSGLILLAERPVRVGDWVVLAAAIGGLEKPDLTARVLRRMELYAPLDSVLPLFSGRAIWKTGWMLGVYHASRGDTAVALQWHDAAGRFPWTGRQQPYIGAIQSDIRSRLARRAGDFDGALREAQRAYDLWNIHTENVDETNPEPAVRFSLADLLRESGAKARAESIFRSLAPPTAWMGFYSTRAALALGELVEARGLRSEASRWYGRAAALWARADSAIVPQAALAIAAAKRLQGAR